MIRQRVFFIAAVCGVFVSFSLADETISTPTMPTVLGGRFFAGNTPAVQRLPVTTGGSVSSEGHPVQYRFDWGDGVISAWGNPVQSKGYATRWVVCCS